MTVTSERQDATADANKVVVRPLEAADLEAADEIMRMAFGTYLNAPDPVQVFGDSDHVHTRFRAAPECAFGAEVDGELVGSNFATRWGSFGFFGPLTVRVDLWDRGIASRLMEPVVDLFGKWGVRQAGLFTFPESPKHVGLYQKFGFWPGHLTPLMAKPISSPGAAAACRTYSEASGDEAESFRDACRRIADAFIPGLDLEREILAAEAQGLGETVLLERGGEPIAFAICHCGGGTEAGSDTCFIKFGAVMPGGGAEEGLLGLLNACEALASERRLGRLVAGVNTARTRAHRCLLEQGFKPFLNGLTMVTPDEPGYERPDALVINDLR
jgi:predicted N-acetyltransferase YhbS